MTPVSLGLDSLLALLLIAALSVGVRLNAKLKVLRESHVGFAKAVGDLDLAATRAEGGLQALRAATQEAHDALLTRIDTARSLASRLERGCEEAGAAAERAETAAQRTRAATAVAERAAPRPRLVETAAAPASGPLAFGGRGEAPDPTAVLRLIETAREEAHTLGALRLSEAAPPSPPPVSRDSAEIATAADAALDAGADRLARFVARRRQARAG